MVKRKKTPLGYGWVWQTRESASCQTAKCENEARKQASSNRKRRSATEKRRVARGGMKRSNILWPGAPVERAFQHDGAAIDRYGNERREEGRRRSREREVLAGALTELVKIEAGPEAVAPRERRWTHCDRARSGRRCQGGWTQRRAGRQAKRRSRKRRILRVVTPKGAADQREQAPHHHPDRNLAVQSLLAAIDHPVPFHRGFIVANPPRPDRNLPIFQTLTIANCFAFTVIRAIRMKPRNGRADAMETVRGRN